MTFQTIKKSVISNKRTKPTVIILLCLILFFYFKHFFTTGINYMGQFLKKESTSSERIYAGSNEYGDIRITVQGIVNQDRTADVIYLLPDHYEYFTVEFIDENQWDAGIRTITDIDDNVIFEGKYDKVNDTFTDKNEKLPFEFNVQPIYSDFDLYTYSNSISHIVDTIYGTNQIIRGELRTLIFALLLFIYTYIDHKFPLFFFRLQYSRAVYNPEPSEMFIFWQEISWYVIPLIGIVLMIIAL